MILWFLIDPLHYVSSRSDFGFEFVEIFVIEKRLLDSSRSGVFLLQISLRIRSQNQNRSKGSVRDLSRRTGLCKNTKKSASLPCPFKPFHFFAAVLRIRICRICMFWPSGSGCISQRYRIDPDRSMNPDPSISKQKYF